MKSIEDKLFLVKRKKDTESHIKVNQKICRKCSHKICLTVCPAKTYEEGHKKISVSYDNCLECGACRVVCIENGISWENPRGEFGISFVNG